MRDVASMAHELTPKDGRPPLPIDEIVRRLQDAFAHVEVDVDRASRELEESARYMARVGGPHFDNADVERARAAMGRSAYVVIADDPATSAAYLSFLLEPDHEA